MLWVSKWRGGKKGRKKRKKKKEILRYFADPSQLLRIRDRWNKYLYAEQEQSREKIIKTRCSYLFALVLLRSSVPSWVWSGVQSWAAGWPLKLKQAPKSFSNNCLTQCKMTRYFCHTLCKRKDSRCSIWCRWRRCRSPQRSIIGVICNQIDSILQ